ncbi:MAG: glycosyltransferase family 39 protein, partial [Candidatus Omnitrophota bacterium]
MKAPKRELFVAVVLGFLMLLAFSIRLDNFRKSEWQTIDEIVYYRLGSQITRNLADYHTIPYARELMARGRDLPEYFTRPLFKHPPLFSFLISLSIRFFGDNLESALYPSLFLGVLMIPLIYLLGLSIYDHRVGLLGALFVSLDPVSIICSQKVWMDTTVSFFMVLAVFLFIRGLKSGRDGFFVLSGLASGLAAATKYPGILATLCVVAYALIYRRDLFRNKGFFLGLGMPVVVLLPWFFWNYQIYGKDFLKM